jgi:hypothetical protein
MFKKVLYYNDGFVVKRISKYLSRNGAFVCVDNYSCHFIMTRVGGHIKACLPLTWTRFFRFCFAGFRFRFFITIFFHEDIEMRKLLRHLCLTLSGILFLLCHFVFPSLWVIVSFLFLCFFCFFVFLSLWVYRFFSACLFFEFWLSHSFCFIILSLRLSFYNKLHFLFSVFF